MTIERDKGLREALIMDMTGLWRTKTLLHIFTQKGNINGARFSKDGTRILACSDDGTARLWDIASDTDFPIDHIKLQVMAITGTFYDANTNTVNVISPAKWREIKERYMELAAQHYKSCRYPEGNVFRRLFPKEAQKIRPYPPKPDKPEPKRD